jgi:ectoine hydroxylase-related dioxygenase (phytanoyl-CoA dioxygenase family)
MMSAIHFDPALSDDERRQRVYAGDIILLSPTAATKDLIALARTMLETAFAPHDPRDVHKHLSKDEVTNILTVLKPKFIHQPECKTIIKQMLEEQGADIEKVYFDVPRLRSSYPGDFLKTGIAFAFHPHRDTWYSAPMCQINWWLPVYPIESENAMGFYPGYFHDPVANNSEVYNYFEWNKTRSDIKKFTKNDTRVQPTPQQALDPVTVRFLPPPGGTIVFSGAQLHESVPNTTDLARYSIDFRTVHIDDVLARDGARNIDSRCTGTTMRDYLRASDLEHLPEEAVSLYDDGTEVGNDILYFGDRMA